MNLVSRNLAANLAGRAWSTALGLILVPFYLRFLGIEAYGLIGVFLTLQNLAALADLGLGMSLNREMARLSISLDNRARQRDLLRTFEVVFWVVSVAVGAGIVLLGGWISRDWVSARSLDSTSVASAVRLMGVVVAVQLPFAFYQSGLMGLQRQPLVNGIIVVGGTARGVGALLVLSLIAPTLWAFLLWQVAVGVAQTAAAAGALWWSLRAQGRPRFRLAILGKQAGFASGVAANAIIGASLTQLDKVVLSRMLSLEFFGYYTLAGTVASALWSIIVPVNSAFFPRLTQLVEARNAAALAASYHRACQIMAAAVLPVAALLAVFARPILALWTKSPVAADQAALLVAILVTGTALNGLASVPAYLQTAAGWPQLMLYFNTAAAIVLVPVIVLLTRQFGAPGAASVWVALNVAYLAIFIPIMHRRLLPNEMRVWYRQDLLLPLTAVLLTAAALRWLQPANMGYLATLAFLAAGAILLVSAALAAMPKLRMAGSHSLFQGVRILRERLARA